MTADQKTTLPPDEQEPKAGWMPVPLWLILLFALLFYWGMVYANDKGGGFDTKVYEPYTDYAFVETQQPSTPGNTALGKKVFQGNCEICHQSGGTGSAANNCPPLAGSDWVNAQGANRIIRIVLNGAQGPITVAGKQWNGGTMTPFKGNLTDEQIAAVLSYVRTEWGNKAEIVEPDKVKEIRAKEAGFPGYRSAPELLKISDHD